MKATGIAIGTALSEAANVLLTTIMLSFAGGTLIYVACSEIIVEEFDRSGWKWTKIFVFTLGAAIIVVLWFTDSD